MSIPAATASRAVHRALSSAPFRLPFRQSPCPYAISASSLPWTPRTASPSPLRLRPASTPPLIPAHPRFLPPPAATSQANVFSSNPPPPAQTAASRALLRALPLPCLAPQSRLLQPRAPSRSAPETAPGK